MTVKVISKVKSHKLLCNAAKYLVGYIMMVFVFVCYFEVGHDKGWPKADLMYTRFHGLVVSAMQTIGCEISYTTNN